MQAVFFNWLERRIYTMSTWLSAEDGASSGPTQETEQRGIVNKL